MGKFINNVKQYLAANNNRKKSPQLKMLLSLKPNQGFTTRLVKAQGLRAAAIKAGFKVGVHDQKNGTCLVYRKPLA